MALPMNDRPSPLLVLASKSAARIRMLEACGLHFQAEAALVDEGGVKDALRAEGVTAQDTAVALAEIKAGRVAARFGGDVVVVGCDQMLEVDGQWLDKPDTIDGVRAQLQFLRAKKHRLWSAAVMLRSGSRIWHHVDHADLWMRPFSDDFLESYVAAVGADVRDSVGGYHLEGMGAQLFSRIEGDFFTVLGLPLLPLLQSLRDQGVLAT